VTFTLPGAARDWQVVVDTADGARSIADNTGLEVAGRAVVVLQALAS
jgi:hypothetical protein